ncbi:MAG: site-specific integrase, partial [Actinomycetota bacterium]|nr:site-specific integrase [Actinomycetota bacterium]
MQVPKARGEWVDAALGSWHLRRVGRGVVRDGGRPAALHAGSRLEGCAGPPDSALRLHRSRPDHEPDGPCVHRRHAADRRTFAGDRTEGGPDPGQGHARRSRRRAHRSLALRRRSTARRGAARDAVPQPPTRSGLSRWSRGQVGGADLHSRLRRPQVGGTRRPPTPARRDRTPDHRRRGAAQRAERPPQLRSPKTAAGRRAVSIPGALADLLAEQLARPMVQRTGLVFPSPLGEPLRRSDFTRRVWAPATEALGLDGLRFHDLRHTAVALAIRQGAHPKAIQERMGHSSVTVTLDRYGHLYEGLDGQIAASLDEVLRNSRGLAAAWEASEGPPDALAEDK